LRTTELAFTLESHASLDYGASVPLLLLNVPANTPIIPITYSGLDPKAHLEFGRLIKDTFGNTRKRVAIIASGDLSHCLSSDAPMGYKKQGRMFDDIILDAIKSMASSKLLQLKPEVVEQAQQCGYRPLLILFGLLERVNVRPDILSYEAPFGVGYLVADFRLPEYDR
jgi:MEMO1 family protein